MFVSGFGNEGIIRSVAPDECVRGYVFILARAGGSSYAGETPALQTKRPGF
jgi:hypothetical protein